MKSSKSPGKERLGLGAFSVEKARAALTRRDKKFLSYFTQHEKSYSLAKKRSAESLAGRFAAKLAFWDALDIKGPIRKYPSAVFRDIAVDRKVPGPPRLIVKKPLLKKLGIDPGSHILLSITHEKKLAAAAVVIEG